MNDRIRVHSIDVLSDNWYVLRKATFDYRRPDGTWQRQSREVYDRGNGAAILLYNRQRNSVVLTRQFRFPTYVNGNADGMLIEVCAGLLDQDDPVRCIRREAQEETGYRIDEVRQVFETFMSPGSVSERLFMFVGEYTPHDKVGSGGGEVHEGEDIEVLELPFREAMAMVRSGAIRDAKTVMLLQHAQIEGLLLP